MRDAFGVERHDISKALDLKTAKQKVKENPELSAAGAVGAGFVAHRYGSMGRAVRVASKMKPADYARTSAGLSGRSSAKRPDMKPGDLLNPFKVADYRTKILREQRRISRQTRKEVPGAKKVYPSVERYSAKMTGSRAIKRVDPDEPTKKWEYVVRPGKVRAKADRKIIDGLIANSEKNPKRLYRYTADDVRPSRAPASWTSKKEYAEQHGQTVEMARMQARMAGANNPKATKLINRVQGTDFDDEARSVHEVRSGRVRAVNVGGLTTKTSQDEWISSAQGVRRKR